MSESSSDSAPRGRTQNAKPLTTGAIPGLGPSPEVQPDASSSSSAAANAILNTGTPTLQSLSDTSTGQNGQSPKTTPDDEPLVVKLVSRETLPFAEKPKSSLANKVGQGPKASEATSEVNTTQTSDGLPSTAASASSADPLQITAEEYPWLLVKSTLDACLPDAEKVAKKADQPEDEVLVAEGEEHTAVGKADESERLVDFCTELSSDNFVKEAPAIMKSFTLFGEASESIEAEALQLAMTTPSLESEEPLQAFRAMMDKLDALQEQASELESAILRITEQNTTTAPTTDPIDSQIPTPPPEVGDATKDDPDDSDGAEKDNQLEKDADTARTQIIGVFAACLPVLRARVANLTMAQELIDSAQENFSLALRMESMGID